MMQPNPLVTVTREMVQKMIVCVDGKHHIFDVVDGKRLADTCRCGRKRLRKMT